MNEIEVQRAASDARRGAAEIVEIAEDTRITSQAELDAVATSLAAIKRKAKELEQIEKSITTPMRDAMSRVRELFAEPRRMLAGAEASLKSKAAAYIEAERKAERDRAAKARAEAEEEAKARAALAAERGMGPQAPRPVSIEPARKVQASTGTMQTAEVWEFEIVDAAQIPREFLVLDTAKIRSHVIRNKGENPIPGVRAYARTQIRSTG